MKAIVFVDALAWIDIVVILLFFLDETAMKAIVFFDALASAIVFLDMTKETYYLIVNGDMVLSTSAKTTLFIYIESWNIYRYSKSISVI